jgi:hypothetical protein
VIKPGNGAVDFQVPFEEAFVLQAQCSEPDIRLCSSRMRYYAQWRQARNVDAHARLIQKGFLYPCSQ